MDLLPSYSARPCRSPDLLHRDLRRILIMSINTHRFEARDLDRLVGAWPAERQLYDSRSLLQHADRIRCPVLFFQGFQDNVLPPEQTERMAAALRSNGIPVEVQLFEDEGHGFRNQTTQVQVLEETEAFFRRQLGLPIP